MSHLLETDKELLEIRENLIRFAGRIDRILELGLELHGTRLAEELEYTGHTLDRVFRQRFAEIREIKKESRVQERMLRGELFVDLGHEVEGIAA